MTDEDIIRRTRDGDAQAFGLLVERYRARLFGLAFHLAGDYDAACDLTQEALIAAYDALGTLRDPTAFPYWAAGILRNIYRNQGRRHPAETLSLDQMMEAGFDPPAPDAYADEPSEEELEAAARVVASLPDKQREVILLRYSDALSYKEIAETLGEPVTTVTARLHYARRALIERAKKDERLRDGVKACAARGK
ncbi:MAG: sigma-70 family RNA polymerase sigma factor [Candidatus Sumerlaeota bacterium]|nr:sigma-70 family RNA polymerase sigma factor [Candidatus Sumerlaeota bacterium]